jgi:hypothetical protein
LRLHVSDHGAIRDVLEHGRRHRLQVAAETKASNGLMDSVSWWIQVVVHHDSAVQLAQTT